MTEIAVEVIRNLVGQLRRRGLIGILHRRDRCAVVTRLKMTRTATLHRLRIHRRQNFPSQDHRAFRSLQRCFEVRSRLVRVMTLNTRQHTLTVRTVFLRRVILVIESDLTILV